MGGRHSSFKEVDIVKSKNLIILTAVVIAVLAYIVLFERHQPTSEEAREEAEKVLRGFDRDDVQAIEIESESGRVRLEKIGEKWRLREPLDFPADDSVVSSTLGSLANLSTDRRLAGDEVDPAAYGLDQPVAEVTLGMADGSDRTLAVGDELPLGSKRAILLDGGGDVLIASGWFVSDLEREVDDWRSRDVIDFLEDDVASIDIDSGPDSIRAVRLEDHWQLLRPLEDMADGDHLGGVISDLRSMRIEEFLADDVDPEELGLELPEYELTVVRSDGGEPLRLDTGLTREGESGTEVACRRGEGEYFWASERVLTRLSKAPVLWRAKKVMPFETWDAEEFTVTTPDGTASLVHDGNFWRFPDGTEANLTAVQERLRKLAELEASDYDLMAPLTPEMGTVEVVLEAEEGGTPPVLRFSLYAPLEEGGRAMVEVNGRNNVMGVAVEEVEAILEDLDALRPEPPEETADDSE
jgi:hypothetical protein